MRSASSRHAAAHRLGGAAHRAQDAHVGAAAAEVGRQMGADLLLGRARVALEQRLGAHDHAGDAVAALRRLLGLEGVLQRAGLVVGAQAFERARPCARRSAATGTGRRRPACRRRSTVQAPHWPSPQPNLAPFSAEIVAQHVEQRRVGVDVDLRGSAPLTVRVIMSRSPCAPRRRRARRPDHGGLSVKRARR